MNWTEDKQYRDIFSTYKYFGDYKYVVTVYCNYFSKSIHFEFGASSGKKRKELDVFGNKENKSFGGMKALLWIKEAILSFPSWYTEIYNTDNMKLYICIEWSDTKRKNIYSRLTKEGFRFQTIVGERKLIKEVKL